MFKCHLEEKENMLFLNLVLTLALGLHFFKSTTYSFVIKVLNRKTNHHIRVLVHT